MLFKQEEFSQAAQGLQAQIYNLQNELDNIGGGQLICRRKKNQKLYFSECVGRDESGITGNSEKIYMLTRKHFLQEQIRILDSNLKAMSYCSKNYKDSNAEAVFTKMASKYPHLPAKEILAEKECFKNSWIDEPYEKNPFYPEDLIYVTTSGNVVRSKSERDIANALEALNIPYKNDIKIVCGKSIYYADFEIECPDKRIVIWEHFGRTDDKVYCAKNEVRIKDYIEMGYRPWRDLIWTTESDMLDTKNIRKIIQRFILEDW